jgi:hypothetical protein
MNKQELAEQIAIAKKSYKTNTYKSYRECFEAGIAAIVEAMDAPAKEGMKWVKASERLPESGKQVFWNRHEEYPVWAYYSKDGGFHDLVTIDSSGEEEAEPINYDWEWLDESASSSNEDYVASNSNTDDTPLASHSCTVGNSIELIAAERNRQISKEGWTATHDDEHKWGELAIAASCYALHHTDASVNNPQTTNLDGWPWDREWWKPKNPIKDLVRAGALICAEIDRMLRNEQNDERIATQQTIPQGTEAGIKESAKEAISVPAQQGVEEDIEIAARIEAQKRYAELNSHDCEKDFIDIRNNAIEDFVDGAKWLAAQPLQPSLEEKKEDLVANSSATSTVPCAKNINENV